MGLYKKYFVLKPKGNDPHALASRQALLAYADRIKAVDPELALDLERWVEAEDAEQISKAGEIVEDRFRHKLSKRS